MAVAVDAGERGGGHSCRVSGAVMGEWGKREKNTPPLFSGIHIGCGGHGCSGPGRRAVVEVAGRLDKSKRKKEKRKLTFFFLVFISGAVGADMMGQVVGVVVV
jgi:hypothetical protein